MDDLLRLARDRFGVRRFWPGQRELIEAVLSGRDALGILPTGGGKSLCFQLPALLLDGTTVVVSPLIALMEDQQGRLAEAGVDAARLDSTLNSGELRETTRGLAGREYAIVFITPERLEKPETLQLLRQSRVALLVVDEAHCVSQWGHDFRPAYLGVRAAAEALARPPILALTATATPEVEHDIARQLGLREPLQVNLGVDRPNLFYEVLRTVNTAAKLARLAELFAGAPGPGIVYTATIRQAERLHEWAAGQGIGAALYHARLPQAEREDTQSRFMAGEIPVMFATKAFGLGIDKPDVRFVAHYAFPDSVESYYQESGRAGRDGQAARATLLFRLEDRRIQGWFLRGKYPRRGDSLRVYEILRDGRRDGAITTAELAEATGIPLKKVQVIAAQLRDAGVVRRGRRGLRHVKEFAHAEALSGLLTEHERRRQADRERVAAVMAYAQTARCRVRYIKEYFEVEAEERCGHCDNCRDRPDRGRARRARRRSAAPRAAADAIPLQPGEAVRHGRFGEGTVVEVLGDAAVVEFGSGERRQLAAGRLERQR
ncbi:MAG: ATP-dependent DNA helicase RecQ [Acidobacteria bacterium]|nr:ATP-dependent DNA helicase RecQ [Acidobacteriota bacterium]